MWHQPKKQHKHDILRIIPLPNQNSENQKNQNNTETNPPNSKAAPENRKTRKNSSVKILIQKPQQLHPFRQKNLPENVPAALHSLNRLRKSIPGEGTPVHRSDRRPPVLCLLRLLHLYDEPLRRHSLRTTLENSSTSSPMNLNENLNWGCSVMYIYVKSMKGK